MAVKVDKAGKTKGISSIDEEGNANGLHSMHAK